MPRMELEIRRARPSDKRAVVAVVRRNWGGDDYVPRVFDRWVTHRTGPFYVATARDRVVGMGKLTRLSMREAWLEGGRVAPRWRRRGIESALVAHRLDRAAAAGHRVVRFSTASDNTPIRRMARRFGFRRVQRFARYEAAAAPGPAPRYATPREVAAVWRLASGGGGWRWLQIGGGWLWRERVRSDVAAAVRRRRVVVLREAGRPTAFAVVELGHGRRSLQVRLLGGSSSAARALLRLLPAEAARRKAEDVSGYAIEGRSAIFRGAGFRRSGSGAAWLYEKRLANAGGSPRAPSTSRRSTARGTSARPLPRRWA